MKARDLSGQRFGMLTALRVVAGPSVTWLCECQCGRKVKRTSSNLFAAVRAGQKPMCKRCRLDGNRLLHEGLRRAAIAVSSADYDEIYSVSEGELRLLTEAIERKGRL